MGSADAAVSISSKRCERDSSLELLKIVCMVGIVASHVVQSLLPCGGGSVSGPLEATSCIDFRIASPDPAIWVLVALRTLGAWGNTVFVVCSAWFLCKSPTVRLSKVIRMVLDVLTISVVALILALMCGIQPIATDIIKSLFPTTFEVNWFVTCYLFLYVLHPALNWIFEKLGKRGHAALVGVLVVFYMFVPAVYNGGLLFKTELVTMVMEYTIVAYARYYLPETLANKKLNWILFLVGTLGALCAIVLLEQAGLRVGLLSDKMLHFDINGDPFLFLSVFGLFNLLRARPFVNARVNHCASLMLLVYLIHENLMLRAYVRPAVWDWVWVTYGYSMLFGWIALFTVVLFVGALVCAFLYRGTLGKLVERLEPRVERLVRKVCGFVLDWICALT